MMLRVLILMKRNDLYNTSEALKEAVRQYLAVLASTESVMDRLEYYAKLEKEAEDAKK